MAARVADGLLDLKTATEEEKANILDMWEKAAILNPKETKKWKNKERREMRQSKK